MSPGASKAAKEQVVIQIDNKNFTWGIKTYDFDDKIEEITHEVWKIQRKNDGER